MALWCPKLILSIRVARRGEVVFEHPDGCNQVLAAASTRNVVKENPFILSTSVVCLVDGHLSCAILGIEIVSDYIPSFWPEQILPELN